MSTRAIQMVLERYPVNGKQVRPHDLRRTYARSLYDAGMSLLAIKQNLGHSNLRTTEKYIGELGVSERGAPAGVYEEVE